MVSSKTPLTVPMQTTPSKYPISPTPLRSRTLPSNLSSRSSESARVERSTLGADVSPESSVSPLKLKGIMLSRAGRNTAASTPSKSAQRSSSSIVSPAKLPGLPGTPLQRSMETTKPINIWGSESNTAKESVLRTPPRLISTHSTPGIDRIVLCPATLRVAYSTRSSSRAAPCNQVCRTDGHCR
jgi:hypothetical protein